MPQITQLDNDPTPNNNDLLVTVDIGAGTTKNISREQFFTGAPLPANTVDEQAIADGAVTASKTAFGGDYSTSEVNTGFKWIDNKDIYKKTISTTFSGGSLTHSHGIAIDTIISATIVVAGQTLPVLNPGVLGASIGGWATSSSLNIRSGGGATQSGSVVATLVYTK